MVRLLSMDTTSGSILFRRHLPQRMLLIDHILRSNMFPLQHIVQKRGDILEVLYRISEGYWFSPVVLIMTSLFHFEDRVHHLSLPAIGAMPRAFHLPPPRSNEDEPADDSPRGDLAPIAELIGEPLARASPVPPPVFSAPPAAAPVSPASVPQALMPSTSPQSSSPMPTVWSNVAGPSTSTPHP